MADQPNPSPLTLTDSVSSFILCTGNLMTLTELKRMTNKNASEELASSLAFFLSNYETCTRQEIKNTVICRGASENDKIDEKERSEIKLTVKLMLTSFDADIVRTAFEHVVSELGVNTIESLIVSFPYSGETPTRLDVSAMSAIWRAVAELKNEQKVITVGVSDLDTEELRELHEWAEVKPNVNQVNLASCCVMPPEMITFAKENEIVLLTHSDPRDIMPDEELHEILEPSPVFPKATDWRLRWVARYSALVKSRGIVQNKGYIVSIGKQDRIV